MKVTKLAPLLLAATLSSCASVNSARMYMTDLLSPRLWFCVPEDRQQRDSEIVNALIPAIREQISRNNVYTHNAKLDTAMRYRDIIFDIDARVLAPHLAIIVQSEIKSQEPCDPYFRLEAEDIVKESPLKDAPTVKREWRRYTADR